MAENAGGDRGLMQINPWWLTRIEQYSITSEHLYDPCTNIHVGAWILAQNFRDYGRNWESVGIYNAGTSKDPAIRAKATEYILLIQKHYSKLQGR